MNSKIAIVQNEECLIDNGVDMQISKKVLEECHEYL